MNGLIEINKKQAKAGRTPFKMILHKIHPSADEYNENGCSFSRQYTEDNMFTVHGMPFVCQFLDDEQTVPFGAHGECEIVDGEARFKDSVIVGGFEDSYIDDNIVLNGEKISAHIANGWIYNQRFPSLPRYIEEEMDNGRSVKSSVEIYKAKSRGLDSIVYDGGYKEKGRLPRIFDFSAAALVCGVRPSDDTAVMLEINSALEQNKLKEESEDTRMDEKILAQFADSVKQTIVEVNSKNAEYETQIETLNATIVETNATVEELRAAVVATEKERDDNYRKAEEAWAELNILRDEIAKAKVKERIGELNSALSDFSEEEKAFAKDEIKAFNEDPTTVEINSVVDKILVEIGKKAKEDAKIAEQNAANRNNEPQVDDIFADILETNASTDSDEDESIF